MWRLNKYALPAILIVAGLLTIGYSKVTGFWSTQRVAGSIAVLADGSPNPEDVRGSHTLAELVELFEVPESQLRSDLRIPARLSLSTQLKEFESMETPLGLETSTFRSYLAAVQAGTTQEFVNSLSSSREPSELSSVAGSIAASEQEYTFELKGRDTLQTVENLGIELETLYQHFGVDQEVKRSLGVKDFTSLAGTTMTELKSYIQSQLGE